MKKITKILFTMIIVLPMCTGCTFGRVTENNIAVRMETAVNNTFSEQASDYQNMHKTLYSYYLPDHVGKRASTAYSNILISDNYDVLMSLNASAVIIDKYYEASAVKAITTYDIALYSEVFSGTYSDGRKTEISVSIFKFDSSYYLLVKAEYFSFLSNCPLAEMPIIVKDIIRVARSTTTDQTAILTAYSKKENINYQQETTTLFSQSIPENGTLAEMLENYFPDYDFSDDSQNYDHDEEESSNEDYANDSTTGNSAAGETE
ncbi:hypothetical protein SDC9_116901 [bioreactor metagenome]|uniref:Uncharacterized protein n=1 Tax=bioreactor metagenome TaxID=1076179 RepID=A0A645C3N8_9ZZZZ|nr:hypothetical protein [Erysipelotrichaceae bacterium]